MFSLNYLYRELFFLWQCSRYCLARIYKQRRNQGFSLYSKPFLCVSSNTHTHTHTHPKHMHPQSILEQQYLHTLSVSENQALKAFNKNKTYVSGFHTIRKWLFKVKNNNFSPKFRILESEGSRRIKCQASCNFTCKNFSLHIQKIRLPLKLITKTPLSHLKH